jgi:hypothetical protein
VAEQAEGAGEGEEHLGGGGLLAVLDGRQVRIGDPGAVGEVFAVEALVGSQHLDGAPQGLVELGALVLDVHGPGPSLRLLEATYYSECTEPSIRVLRLGGYSICAILILAVAIVGTKGRKPR